MKVIGWLVVLAAAVFGFLWLRRRGYLNGLLPIVGAPPFYPPPPGGLVPVPITPGASSAAWVNDVAPAVGGMTGLVSSEYCKSEGGDPRQCQLLGRVTGWAGEQAVRVGVQMGPERSATAVSTAYSGNQITAGTQLVVSGVKKVWNKIF